jgi:hypothetical protein
MKLFFDEIDIYVGRLQKADCPPKHGWASPNQLRPEWNKKSDPPLSEREFLLCYCFPTRTLPEISALSGSTLG